MAVRRRLATSLLVILVALPVFAQSGSGTGPAIPATTSAINSPTPLSQRVVAYDMDAKYNAKNHSLDATETLTYHNLTGQPLDTFPFHLYLNGFQPTSTWMREGKREGTRDRDLKRGTARATERRRSRVLKLWARVISLRSSSSFIPTTTTKTITRWFRCICQSRSLRMGTCNSRSSFTINFRRPLERTGWNRDFVLGGQWFPKVGVWWHGAWNCHQFHAYTEFFADFGVYDVKLTVPQYEVVGASGIEVEQREQS